MSGEGGGGVEKQEQNTLTLTAFMKSESVKSSWPKTVQQSQIEK